MRARQGTKREYETVIILRSGTNKAAILELVQKMMGVFKHYGSTLIKIENWGSRTLAYPIKRANTGVYLYWRFLGGSDVVREFERNLEITDSVLRYHTVKVDEDIDPDARPSEITEDLLDAVSEPPPEPVAAEEDAPEGSSDDEEDDYRDDEGDN
ncbi:MAG: 30S ribosomal protein S6 [Nannocystaceae bacterium]